MKTTSQIFKNKLLLSFKDERMGEMYVSKEYFFLKFLLFQIFMICFTVTNLLLNNFLEERKKNPKSQQFVFFMNGVILSIHIVLFIFYLTVKLIKKLENFLKNRNYYFLSYILFSNILIQSQLTREILKNVVGEMWFQYLIPFTTSSFVMFYVFFIDKNFLVIFFAYYTATTIVILFSIDYTWMNDNLGLIFLLVLGITITGFTYIFDKNERKKFILYETAKSEIKRKRDFIENLSSGVLILEENKFDYNSKLKEFLTLKTEPTISENDSGKRPSRIKSNNLLQYQKENLEIIHKFLLNDFNEYNLQLDQKIRTIFSSNNELLINIPNCNNNSQSVFLNLSVEATYKRFINNLLLCVEEDIKYQEFTYIGTKNYNKSTLNVYFRYNKISECIEISVNDISSIVEVEDLKASDRYKKLFLNKFSHEFKNPLLNIMQIISNMKLKIIDTIKKGSGNNLNIINNNHVNLEMQRHGSFPIMRRLETNLFSDISQNSLNGINVPVTPNNLSPSHKSPNTLFSTQDLKDLTHIKDLSNYMISLIGDFDFISNSNLETLTKDISQNKILEIGKFNLEKLIKNCIRIFTTRAELNDKNITFVYEIDNQVPNFINSDFRRVKQILLNLLSNAYKFTNNGEIFIKVNIHKEENVDLINFMIKDTGTGFNPENVTNTDKEDILKKMNCNERSNNNIYGIGLGLNIVKVLVSILGKNFKISSKNKIGTEVSFSIYLNANSNSDSECIVNNGAEAKEVTTPTTRKEVFAIPAKSSIHKGILRANTHNPLIPIETDNLLMDKPHKDYLRYLEIPINSVQPFNKSLKRTKTMGILKNVNSKMYNSNHHNKGIKRATTDRFLKDTIFSKISEEEISPAQEGTTIINNNPQNSNMKTEEEASTVLLQTYHFSISESDKIQPKNTKDNFRTNTFSNHNNIMEKSFEITTNGQYTGGMFRVRKSEKESSSKSEVSLANFLNFNASPIKKVKTGENFHIGDKNLIIPSPKAEPVTAIEEADAVAEFQPKLRILLVDDEKLIRQSEFNMISKFFAKLKIPVEVVECSDGAECLYQLFKGIQNGIKYDYIITDETMNFMRGSLMAKTIHALISDSMMYDVKLYMVTSYESSAIVNNFGNIVDGIITKPLSRDHIMKIFSSV